MAEPAAATNLRRSKFIALSMDRAPTLWIARPHCIWAWPNCEYGVEIVNKKRPEVVLSVCRGGELQNTSTEGA
jgi:hypothetical protein